MIIKLDELNIKDEIEIDEEVFKDSELDKRIIDLKNSRVIGKIYYDTADDMILECTFTGTMIINDSISLKEVPYDFEIDLNEKVEEIVENSQDVYEKTKNTLDLKRILWQNIVLEVPISYTEVKDAELKGRGWELVKEDKKVKETDPRLKKLEDLLERR